MTGDPGRGTVPCQLTRHATRAGLPSIVTAMAGPWPMRARTPREHVSSSLIRIHPRRIAARNVRQHRLGWHARDIAVEKAGQ